LVAQVGLHAPKDFQALPRLDAQGVLTGIEVLPPAFENFQGPVDAALTPPPLERDHRVSEGFGHLQRQGRLAVHARLMGHQPCQVFAP
jgi:hypothetical protein